MSISSVGGASSTHHLHHTHSMPPKPEAKATEEAAESPQQEAVEKGRVDIKA